ncbi:MAG: alanine--tRNA ligase [Planctomycetota bacterium]|nr:alanine--tRNA ligase [Planctomycetota bacterium]
MNAPRTGAEIRQAFLGFYQAREHLHLASDSLIPSHDPTLLFTGAGMNQFKDEFLGKGRDFKRATTVQKCIRVPDLENVGRTPRHHTFFEMLGNFSFGDYFKKETIAWEWEFFTQTLGWASDRFYVTVYHEDEEAFQLWHDGIGLPEAQIYRFGEKENFWPSSAPSKGPNGPCGPCSEIYWDQTPGKPLPSNQGLEELPERFLEVGNFVFTQFDRQENGSLPPLPQNNIDVGLGLERIAAVAQGVDNNLETDLFAPSLTRLQSLSGKTYGKDRDVDIRMRRIADHVRAVFFCIADGAAPAREGRGYIVRKILRRAVRDAIDLQIPSGFFTKLLPDVQETMGQSYPELLEQQQTILAMVDGEENRFRDVYDKGITRLYQQIESVQAKNPSAHLFPGDLAFELHDTFGFPSDITEVVVKERGLAFDTPGFQSAMDSQRERARSASEISKDVFAESLASQLSAHGLKPTSFLGYESTSAEASTQAFLVEGILTSEMTPGQEGIVLLDHTPFYAEGGGQIGDSGELLSCSGDTFFQVTHTTSEDGFSLHHGKALSPGVLGATVTANVHAQKREAVQRHHTATHLLQAALRTVLGDHVQQAGSHVDETRLRFDYTHHEAPGAGVFREVEGWVQNSVMAAVSLEAETCALEDAKKSGVMALFGEKYSEEVRVVRIPGYSAELCGGTHVHNTGAIGAFRILTDRSLAAGVRRMEAVAGDVAAATIHHERTILQDLAARLKCQTPQVLERVQSLQKKAKVSAQSTAPATLDPQALLDACAQANQPLWKHFPEASAEHLRTLIDSIKGKSELPPLLLLTGGLPDQVPFALLTSKESGLKAGTLAKEFGGKIGGGGGGRPDFAQGQGTSGSNLEQIIQTFFNSLPSPA